MKISDAIDELTLAEKRILTAHAQVHATLVRLMGSDHELTSETTYTFRAKVASVTKATSDLMNACDAL